MYTFLKPKRPSFTLCELDMSKSGILANSGDMDEMLHYAAFHQGLHGLQRS